MNHHIIISITTNIVVSFGYFQNMKRYTCYMTIISLHRLFRYLHLQSLPVYKSLNRMCRWKLYMLADLKHRFPEHRGPVPAKVLLPLTDWPGPAYELRPLWGAWVGSLALGGYIITRYCWLLIYFIWLGGVLNACNQSNHWCFRRPEQSMVWNSKNLSDGSNDLNYILH